MLFVHIFYDKTLYNVCKQKTSKSPKKPSLKEFISAWPKKSWQEYLLHNRYQKILNCTINLPKQPMKMKLHGIFFQTTKIKRVSSPDIIEPCVWKLDKLYEFLGFFNIRYEIYPKKTNSFL